MKFSVTIIALVSCSLLFLGCAGASFYSAEFRAPPEDCPEDLNYVIFDELEAVASRFGMTLYINDERLLLFRKAPNAELPSQYEALKESASMQVTLVYVKGHCKVLVNQRRSTRESQYVRDLRIAVEEVMERLFENGNFEVSIEIRNESALS